MRWKRVYRFFLLAYPASYRRRFGAGMGHAFDCDLARAREEGRGALVFFCLRSFLHAVGLGLIERLSLVWRAGRGGSWLPWADLRLSVRRLRRSPRFTLVALLTLALGIGANSALFSVVHSVLLSPLPFDDSERLVFAWETRDEGGRIGPVSPLNLREWRGSASLVEAMAGVRLWPFNVTGGGTPERVTGAQVSSGLLALLRVTPARGREFTTAEERPGAEPVCMVSHGFWLQRLGGDPDLGSLRLTLNGESHAVVGVLPEGLNIPGLGPRPILTPLPLDPDDLGFWSNHNTRVLGRIGESATLEAADAELNAVAAGLQEVFPDWNDGIGATLLPARDQLVQGVSRSLWLLLGSVAFVLLIACANIASLLLARAMEAEREMAVRTALGAHRGSILRLALSEALVLGLVGGLLGLGFCYLGVAAIQRWAPGNLPRMGEVGVSLPVLGFTLAVSIGTAFLFGLLPAVRSSRVDPQAALKEGGRGVGPGKGQRAQRIFVAGQVAMAVVLLVGSGLLLRTFGNLLQVDPGFEAQGRVALQVSLPRASYPDRESVTGFLDRLHRRLDALPGVESSGSSVGLPFQGAMWRKHMTLEDRPAATLPEVPVVDVSIVTPHWLKTLGIPLVRGRALLDQDEVDGPFVAVVNEAFVRTYLPDDDPLGRRLRLAAPDHLLPEDLDVELPWYTIVGVVGDVRRWNLASEAGPEVFIHQRHDMDVAREFFVVAHTSLPEETLMDPMRKAVWEVDGEQPVAWVRSMGSLSSAMVAGPRFNAVLLGAFSLTALLLSVIGVYGLMANVAATRRREIGLRMALGAQPREVIGKISGQGMLPALGGMILGLLLAGGLARLMGGLLFGVQSLDAPTYLTVVLVMIAVAGIAAVVPSWRATRLDPTKALRET